MSFVWSLGYRFVGPPPRHWTTSQRQPCSLMTRHVRLKGVCFFLLFFLRNPLFFGCTYTFGNIYNTPRLFPRNSHFQTGCASSTVYTVDVFVVLFGWQGIPDGTPQPVRSTVPLRTCWYCYYCDARNLCFHFRPSGWDVFLSFFFLTTG